MLEEIRAYCIEAKGSSIKSNKDAEVFKKRLNDNQALASINHNDSILPVFIYDASFYTKPLGQASKVWLHHSLIDLKQLCTSLSFYKGSILEIVPLLVKKFTLEKVIDGKVITENHPSYYSISKSLGISYHRTRYYHLNCNLKN